VQEELCCDVPECTVVEDIIDIDDLGKKGPPECPTIGGKKGAPVNTMTPKGGTSKGG
jgi:hypothetical protein